MAVLVDNPLVTVEVNEDVVAVVGLVESGPQGPAGPGGIGPDELDAAIAGVKPSAARMIRYVAPDVAAGSLADGLSPGSPMNFHDALALVGDKLVLMLPGNYAEPGVVYDGNNGRLNILALGRVTITHTGSGVCWKIMRNTHGGLQGDVTFVVAAFVGGTSPTTLLLDWVGNMYSDLVWPKFEGLAVSGGAQGGRVRDATTAIDGFDSGSYYIKVDHPRSTRCAVGFEWRSDRSPNPYQTYDNANSMIAPSMSHCGIGVKIYGASGIQIEGGTAEQNSDVGFDVTQGYGLRIVGTWQEANTNGSIRFNPPIRDGGNDNITYRPAEGIGGGTQYATIIGRENLGVGCDIRDPGLIEITEERSWRLSTNHLRWSEDLTNAVWTKGVGAGGTGGAPVVTSGIADPFGGTNGQHVEFGASTFAYVQQTTALANKQGKKIALSVWLKGNTDGIIRLGLVVIDYDFRTVSVTKQARRTVIVRTIPDGQTDVISVRLERVNGFDLTGVDVYGFQLDELESDPSKMGAYLPTTGTAITTPTFGPGRGTRAHSGLTGLTTGDDHTQYQLRSEKDVANGYPGLSGAGFVLASKLGSGTPTAAKFLRGDGTWQVVAHSDLSGVGASDHHSHLVGTLAARPAANSLPAGSTYYATDVNVLGGALYRTNGTTWTKITTGPPAIPIWGSWGEGYYPNIVNNIQIGAANTARGSAFRLSQPRHLAKIVWRAGSTMAGNYDIAVTDGAGTRLWSKGSTAVPATSASITETVNGATGLDLSADTTYIFWLSFDNSSSMFSAINALSGNLAQWDLGGGSTSWMTYQNGTSFPFPASLTPAAAGGSSGPAGLFLTA